MKQIIIILLVLLSYSSSAIDTSYFIGFLDSVINANHLELVEANKLMENPEKQAYFEKNTDFVNNPELLGTIYLYNEGAFGVVYKKNLNESPQEEYIIDFSITPIIKWHNEIFVFYVDENTPRLVANTEVWAKNGNAEVSFENVSSNDYFDIVVDSEIITTYYGTEVSIYKLLQSGLKCIYSASTLFYDWKDYGKSEYMDINNYQDTLTDSQSRRVTTNYVFVNNEKDNRKDIREITIDAIVNEPDKDSDMKIEDYSVFKIIKKEENLLIWDFNKQEYK